MTVHACQSQSSDFSRLATGIRHTTAACPRLLLWRGLSQKLSGSRQGSEATDWQAPASPTVCRMPDACLGQTS
eukprot:scaffold70292_cov87-Cyclotella_meneghiniana.AAC.7